MAQDLATIDAAAWKEAERRAALIGALAMGRCSRTDAAAAATALGLTTRHIYALVRRIKASDGGVTSLVPGRSSGGRGKRRLTPAMEAIIRTVIDEVWLTRQKLTVAAAVLEVRRRCLAAGIRAPARSTIYRRILDLDPVEAVSRRRGAAAVRALAPVGPTSLEAPQPLSVMQMDHTPVDVIIVDEALRRPIGRPYITVAIDLYSRCIAGFCLTLDPPSAVSVGLCLTHAVLPKDEWLKQRQIEGAWPVFGKPAVLHVDNAREFHSEALRRGCVQHGIALEHRPVARPHYGGVVERVIGCLMQLVHELPGTTFSNPTERGDYPSENKACLTLAELERWMTLAIIGVYHQRLHTGVDMVPVVRWKQALKGAPRLPQDSKRFLIDFLPIVRRRLRRQGVVIDAIAYDSPAIRMMSRAGTADEPLLIRRDPRDLSRVFVFDPALASYHEAAYRTLSRPPITLWEHKEAVRALHADGFRHVDEAAIFAAVEKMRSIAADAARKTKAARRRLERTPTPILASLGANTPLDPVAPDVTIEPYEVEEW